MEGGCYAHYLPSYKEPMHSCQMNHPIQLATKPN